MQQLPPFPDDAPGYEPVEPSTPGQPTEPGTPSEAPSESPPMAPDVDVPAPNQPGTQPSPTPISPTGTATTA
jgi:hypothetical protein